MTASLRRLAHLKMRSPMTHLSPSSRLRRTQTLTNLYPYPHPLQIGFHVTPIEMIILAGALGICVALLCWLGWIAVTYVFRFIRDTIEDNSKGARGEAGRREREIENAPEYLGKIGLEIGKAAYSVLDGLARRDRSGESIGLLGERDNSRVERVNRYGYYEGALYQDRGRYPYPDGMSGSDWSGKAAVIHWDDCAGQCGEARKVEV